MDEGDLSKVEEQLRILNSAGNLNQELDADQLLEPLLNLGVDQALEILSHVEEKAGEVKNPTAYVMTAVKQRGKGKGSKGQKERRGKGVIKTQLKEKAKGSHFDHASVEKVKKRISWLNDKAGLNESLNYDKVGELLLSSGPIGEVMKIFKTLEENASEIRNPNGWAVSAARRLAEEGVAPEPKSSKPNQDFRNEPLDKQLRAHRLAQQRGSAERSLGV